ncbi:MAG: TniQ family protein [Propionivibrio sp.]|nr:TniQ family protein [Propionivibrio sp.]
MPADISAASDLLGFSPSFLPTIAEGETLFSWCCRFHRLSGNTSAILTSRELFGHPTVGLRRDFPVCLDNFTAITRATIGSSLVVLRERTVFGHYMPFLEETATQQAIRNICSGENMRIKGPIGLLKGNHEVPASLKACAECMDEDRNRIGATIWHLEHQWPSTWVCRRHRSLLRIVSADFHLSRVVRWLLPEDIEVVSWMPSREIEVSHLDRLHRLAEWTRRFATVSDSCFRPNLLRHSYLVKAKSLGWIALDGSLRFRTLCNAFLDAHRGLEVVPGLALLNDVAKVSGGFLGTLLRSYVGHRVPAKHLLLMAFLFESPEEFFAIYEKTGQVHAADGANGLHRQLTDLRVRLASMVENERCSINHAASTLGIPVSMAVRVIQKQQIRYRRRPRVLDSEREIRLVAMLRLGEGRETIATVLGVRRSFIKDYLASHPDLRETWQSTFNRRNRDSHRAHFLTTLSQNPNLPIKRIRRLPKNGFQWLYNNDREWLLQQLPSLWSR